MMERPPIEPEGMRFVASAVRRGFSPPGVPYLLEDAATEIERLRALFVLGEDHEEDCNYLTLNSDLKCNCVGGRARASTSPTETDKSQ